MSNELWKEAVDLIDSRYTDRAAKSFRAESGRTVVIEPVLIYPPEDTKPKSRLKGLITAAASVAAAAALIAGGALIIDRVKSVPADPEQSSSEQSSPGQSAASERPDVPAQTSAAVPAAETTVVYAPPVMDESEKAYIYYYFGDLSSINYYKIVRADNFITNAKSLSAGCTGAGNYFAADSSHNTVCRVTPGGEMTFYGSVKSETENFTCEFHFTEDGPAALLRVYNSEYGLENVYIAFYDDDMTLKGLSKVTFPDSFLCSTYITYDGKYLIDNHYSVYLDSPSYVRVYEIGEKKTTLLKEFRTLGNFEFPAETEALTVKNVIACNISKDGKKLIVLAEAEKNGRYEAVYLTEDIGAGNSSCAEELQYDARYLKYGRYDGGIAVFMPGIAEMLSGSKAEHYVFDDLRLDEVKTEYAVSPNGRFIQTLTPDEEGLYYSRYIYDTEKAAGQSGIKWLERKDARDSRIDIADTKSGGFLTGINSGGDVFTVLENTSGENVQILRSVSYGPHQQEDLSGGEDPFDETTPMFETQTDRENRLKYSALAEKLIDGGYTVTAGYGYDPSENSGHTGIDITPDGGDGTPVRAYADGTVVFADWGDQKNSLSGYGKCVIIYHGDGLKTLYAHCGELYVSEGDTVNAGDVIAAVGATGFTAEAQLHFAAQYCGEIVDPAEIPTLNGQEQ